MHSHYFCVQPLQIECTPDVGDHEPVLAPTQLIQSCGVLLFYCGKVCT